jgi:hypothetical protein
MVMVAEPRTVDNRHTSVVCVASTTVYLADHAVETELMRAKPTVECGNFPHWGVDTDS